MAQMKIDEDLKGCESEEDRKRFAVGSLRPDPEKEATVRLPNQEKWIDQSFH